MRNFNILTKSSILTLATAALAFDMTVPASGAGIAIPVYVSPAVYDDIVTNAPTLFDSDASVRMDRFMVGLSEKWEKENGANLGRIRYEACRFKVKMPVFVQGDTDSASDSEDTGDDDTPSLPVDLDSTPESIYFATLCWDCMLPGNVYLYVTKYGEAH